MPPNNEEAAHPRQERAAPQQRQRTRDPYPIRGVGATRFRRRSGSGAAPSGQPGRRPDRETPVAVRTLFQKRGTVMKTSSALKEIPLSERRALASDWARTEATPAVSGEGGHGNAMATARTLRCGFSLPEADALQVFLDSYNPRCQPPWSEAEARHKIHDAGEQPRSEGWMLRQKREPSRTVKRQLVSDGEFVRRTADYVERASDPAAIDKLAEFIGASGTTIGDLVAEGTLGADPHFRPVWIWPGTFQVEQQPGSTPKRLSAKGRTFLGWWRSEHIPDTPREVFVTEGAKDALALIEGGFDDGEDHVMATSCAKSWKAEHCRVARGRVVNVVLDRDKAGADGVQKAVRALRAAGATEVRALDWDTVPEEAGKDLHEILTRKGPEYLLNAVSRGLVAIAGGDIPGEIGENGENGENEPGVSANSANSPISPLYSPPAEYPEASVFGDFLAYARRISEAPDAVLLGAILPVAGAMLARRVKVRFDRDKFPNLYSILVMPPGCRKGSAVSLAYRLAKIAVPESIISGAASDEALFDAFEETPDRIWIETEGNALLHNWSKSVYGQQVARRALKLYDCEDWCQRFKNGAKKSEFRSIDETSCSMLVATTFSAARFNGIEHGDGLRRRFLYYTATDTERELDWPDHTFEQEWAGVLDAFTRLLSIEGEFPPLNKSHRLGSLWSDIQRDFRSRSSALPMDLESEALANSLREAASHTLKIAMIFQAGLHVKDSTLPATDWSETALETAREHVVVCLDSQAYIAEHARRFTTAEEAEVVYSVVVAEAEEKPGEPIMRTKSGLTRRFCMHSSRRGSMSVEDLYQRILPYLIQKGRASIVRKSGKLTIYKFEPEEE